MSTPLAQYGLIGLKLGHSFSQRFFTEKFAREGIAARYDLYELPSVSGLPDLLDRYPDLRGLNVTIPYKERVLPYLSDLSPEAEAVGAVNTIRREGDRLVGHNTDIYGFERSLHAFLQGEEPTSALILGTGGAAKAVSYVLETRWHMHWQMVSRAPQGNHQLSYAALPHVNLADFRLIINTTPLGMYPDTGSSPALPYEALGPDHRVFDLVYNPAETLLMAQARAQGARVVNGMDMLIYQAERAWEIWQGEDAG
ncbi:MAG: shikimate dehydrogenase [Bacteroidetes bacterium]|nr:MAG: shikimate dehydrogenase [Bacteroidota bacterium]